MSEDLKSSIIAGTLRRTGPEVIISIDEEIAIASDDEHILRADALRALEPLRNLANDAGVAEGVVEPALIGRVDAVCAVRVVAEDAVLADGVFLDDG